MSSQASAEVVTASSIAIENVTCNVFVAGREEVSCFEVALAHRRGRLAWPLAPDDWFDRALGGSGVMLLPLTPGIAWRAVDLPEVHRDPFDRIIIATATETNARLASVNSQFPAYPELDGRRLRR